MPSTFDPWILRRVTMAGPWFIYSSILFVSFYIVFYVGFYVDFQLICFFLHFLISVWKLKIKFLPISFRSSPMETMVAKCYFQCHLLNDPQPYFPYFIISNGLSPPFSRRLQLVLKFLPTLVPTRIISSLSSLVLNQSLEKYLFEILEFESNPDLDLIISSCCYKSSLSPLLLELVMKCKLTGHFLFTTG